MASERKRRLEIIALIDRTRKAEQRAKIAEKAFTQVAGGIISAKLSHEPTYAYKALTDELYDLHFELITKDMP